MKKEKRSVYGEISTQHIEDDGVFHILHVDAWKTADSDEEGTVIAKIVGVNLNGTFHHYIHYKDNALPIYTDVEEAIANGKETLEKHMTEIYGRPSNT